MADNTAQNGTATIAADDIGGGVLVQRVKLGIGVDGSYADITTAAPLPVTVSNTATTGTASAPTITGASTAALAPNTARKGAMFYNDSNVDVDLALGFTATVTSFTVRLLVGAYYEVPSNYTGAINMIGVTVGTTTAAASTTGGIHVTELA